MSASPTTRDDHEAVKDTELGPSAADQVSPPLDEHSKHAPSPPAAGPPSASLPEEHTQQHQQHQEGVEEPPPPPGVAAAATEGAPEDPAAADDEGIMQGHPATQEQAQYETEVKEQDRWLPIANVARIMKTALPDNAKIAKEAKECMQECVSEFISFITSEASEKCQHEKRKTVNGEDIIFAMTSLGFENYSEALRIYLVRYRESNLGKAEAQQPGQGRSATPNQGQAHNSSDEREDGAAGPLGSAGVVSVPGAGIDPSFGGAQESEAPNAADANASYPYPAMSNGSSVPQY